MIKRGGVQERLINFHCPSFKNSPNENKKLSQVVNIKQRRLTGNKIKQKSNFSNTLNFQVVF